MVVMVRGEIFLWRGDGGRFSIGTAGVDEVLVNGRGLGEVAPPATAVAALLGDNGELARLLTGVVAPGDVPAAALAALAAALAAFDPRLMLPRQRNAQSDWNLTSSRPWIVSWSNIAGSKIFSILRSASMTSICSISRIKASILTWWKPDVRLSPGSFRKKCSNTLVFESQ